jgi:hypothetical protein
MTNARCLTEGVDLPAIDCVVFTDPKKSKVDIVQAAGRALRLSPRKKFGYILIPLIIPENENATEAAKDTAFEEIVATIRALATQDSRIIEYLRAVSSGTIPKGGSPVDGITKINVLTKVNEEEFNKSIQLKVWDRVAFGNYRTYLEAENYLHKRNLKTIRDWIDFTKTKNFPYDIPKAPDHFYKNKGWKTWGHFLGSGFIATNLRKYLSYKDAKKYMSKTKIISANQYLNFSKKKIFPSFLPKTPDNIYKNKGWSTWYDFLPYRNNLKKLTKKQLINYYNNTFNFLDYEKAKKVVKKLRIKSKSEYRKIDLKKLLNFKLPPSPDVYYKKYWKGWVDFINSNKVRVNSKIIYKSFSEAKRFIKKFNLQNWEQWQEFAKSDKRPFDIPARPKIIYKNNWVSLHDFIGSSYIPRSVRKYLNYTKAKKFIKKYNFKKSSDYLNFTKSNNFPVNFLPRYPGEVYKNKGWKGWPYFLGLK